MVDAFGRYGSVADDVSTRFGEEEGEDDEEEGGEDHEEPECPAPAEKLSEETADCLFRGERMWLAG